MQLQREERFPNPPSLSLSLSLSLSVCSKYSLLLSIFLFLQSLYPESCFISNFYVCSSFFPTSSILKLQKFLKHFKLSQSKLLQSSFTYSYLLWSFCPSLPYFSFFLFAISLFLFCQVSSYSLWLNLSPFLFFISLLDSKTLSYFHNKNIFAFFCFTSAFISVHFLVKKVDFKRTSFYVILLTQFSSLCLSLLTVQNPFLIQKTVCLCLCKGSAHKSHPE